MSQTSLPNYTIPNPKVANNDQFKVLQNLSTENLIIWLIGKSIEKSIKLSIEDIALESWVVNPLKHSLRGYPHYPDSAVVMKRIERHLRRICNVSWELRWGNVQMFTAPIFFIRFFA